MRVVASVPEPEAWLVAAVAVGRWAAGEAAHTVAAASVGPVVELDVVQAVGTAEQVEIELAGPRVVADTAATFVGQEWSELVVADIQDGSSAAACA